MSYQGTQFGVRPDTHSRLWRKIDAAAAIRQAERDRIAAEQEAERRRQEEERRQERLAIQQRNFRMKMAKFDDLSTYLKNTRTNVILREVAVKHGLCVSQLKIRIRGARGTASSRAHPYQEAAYRLYAEAGLSAPVIGKRLGGRDHTTILRAIKIYAERNGLPLREGVTG